MDLRNSPPIGYPNNASAKCLFYSRRFTFYSIIFSSGTSDITLDSSVLTLLASNTDGSCPTAISQDQIKFKEDSRTGCLILYVRLYKCFRFDADILRASS